MTADEERLADQASAFADELTAIVNGTITTGAAVTSAIVPLDDRLTATVAPGAAEDAPGPPLRPMVPLSLSEDPDEREKAPLWFKVTFRMVLDPEKTYAAVHTSQFGLIVDPRTQRPAFRIEYDRRKDRVPPAHVQIHGASPELAYAYGLLGRTPKPLMDLHFPVGSRRYRPTVEDAIEFLEVSDLLPAIRPGWQDVLADSRSRWEEIQLRAAVRRDPETAASALRDEGFQVTRPASA